jgi:ABC-type Fe3+-hydroxamate transport system substrate-binding protein
MHLFTDDLGRKVQIPLKPQRIISVVPSQTELLYHLGLEEEVIGITKFCIHPAHWFSSKTRVGGTKNLHLEKIKSLQPDLIIANKEENVQEQIEAMAQLFPVWVSDVNNLEDALNMIATLGAITGKEEKATSLKTHIEKAFDNISIPPVDRKPKTIYLIWKDPYMTVGGDTFINNMLQWAGFDNLFSHLSRYPQTSIQEIQSLNCEVLLLSSEPYPFKQKHLEELKALLPGTSIWLADGEMFSWYGSRLQWAPSYFKQLKAQLQAV